MGYIQNDGPRRKHRLANKLEYTPKLSLILTIGNGDDAELDGDGFEFSGEAVVVLVSRGGGFKDDYLAIDHGRLCLSPYFDEGGLHIRSDRRANAV